MRYYYNSKEEKRIEKLMKEKYRYKVYKEDSRNFDDNIHHCRRPELRGQFESEADAYKCYLSELTRLSPRYELYIKYVDPHDFTKDEIIWWSRQKDRLSD